MDAKWIDFFTQLGLTTAGQILLLIVIGFFGKQLIQYFFAETIELKKSELNKDIEKYKQTLNAEIEQSRLELNKILETHRGDLNLLNAKNSRLHDKQLQIIADLYKRIVKMERAFEEMISRFQIVFEDAEKEEQERIQEAVKAYNEYLSYYTENKIFFSDETGVYLDKLKNHFWESHWNYTFKHRTGIKEYKEIKEYIDSAAKTIKEKIPEVLRELEKNFRQLLTVEK